MFCFRLLKYKYPPWIVPEVKRNSNHPHSQMLHSRTSNGIMEEVIYNVNWNESTSFVTNFTYSNDTSTQTVDSAQHINRNFREIALYSVLFVIAAIANLTVFISLLRSRHRKSRINLMITHLAIADLIVTFIMIPLEVR